MSTPTQVRRPWTATLRTAFAGIVGFLAILPFIVESTGLDPQVYPWLGGILAVAAAVTRVLALPQVEAFLQTYVPFLAAARKSDAGRADWGLVALFAVALLVLLLVL